jgi:hypothetical protein
VNEKRPSRLLVVAATAAVRAASQSSTATPARPGSPGSRAPSRSTSSHATPARTAGAGGSGAGGAGGVGGPASNRGTTPASKRILRPGRSRTFGERPFARTSESGPRAENALPWAGSASAIR